MAKIIVTKELAETLKTLRIQNGIKSNELATKINKSPAYITKLEKGAIQTLKEEEFDKILGYILKDLSNSDEVAETLYSSLKIKYSDEEIERQLWFNNFDTVVRLIPLPIELIEEINKMIEECSINKEYLLKMINSNQFLSDEEINNDSIPYNEWYEDENKGTCIKIKLDEKIYYGILNGEVDSISYIYPYTILYYIFVIKSEKSIYEMKNLDCNEFQNNATSILNKHKFYSILERERLLSGRRTEEEKEAILNSFDLENSKIINGILGEFKFIADANIVVTNERLKLFLENLTSDVGLMLKLVSLKFNKLEGCDVETKKAFIKEVEELIEKYCSTEKDIELY